MKRFLFFSFVLPLALAGQQTPWFPADGVYSSGVQQVNAPFELHSPLLFSNAGATSSAQVDYVAGQRVMLKPGFEAGNFSGSGYFHAQIGAEADFEVAFLQPNEHLPNVGIHEKLEIGMNLPAGLQQQVDQWITSQYTSGINPFDPEQISVEAVISNGISSYLVYGFYYKEFIRDPLAIGQPYTGNPVIPANWIPQPTAYEWRIRFAPPEIGFWNCTISIRLNNSTSFSHSVNNLRFRCIGSANQGWLEKGTNDWYLRYSRTHNSFFALGQNIAWNDEYAFYGKYPFADVGFFNLYVGGYMDVLDWTENLADNGGNMVRFVSRPRSFDIEWEHLNNYYEGMNRAWELDRMFELCEEKNMKIFFCMEFHPKYGVQSDEAVWTMNPYNIELPGIDHPDDFLTDAMARKKYKAKLRYYMARWGYSTSLGVFQLLSEMNGWLYEDGNLEQNPPAQTDQLNWHNEMLAYVIALTAYRPILTSSSYANEPRNYNHSVFDSQLIDITTYHSYFSQRDINKRSFDNFNKNILDRGTHTLWPSKPTVFDEIGLKFPGDPPVPDHNDIDGCSDISYHNELWASAFTGGVGTGFYWWQWFNNDYRAANYIALNIFFNGIDFENTQFKKPSFWEDASTGENDPSESVIEVLYNLSDNRNQIIGWVHNATAYYGNINENCPDRNGATVASNLGNFPSDDDPYSNPVGLGANTVFKIENVNNLASYSFHWYLTRTPGGEDSYEDFTSNIFGNIWPTWKVGAEDWAFKAFRPGNNFRLSVEIPNDTLRCGEDTLQAYGNHELDSLETFSYYWIFGNGNTSSDRNPLVIYTLPGAYDVMLIVSDNSGWSDTLRQTIIKLDCGDSRFANSTVPAIQNLAVYPNPCTKVLNILLDSSWNDSVSISVYSVDGRMIFTKQAYGQISILSFDGIAEGYYFVLVRDIKHEEIVKVIHSN
jgi:hypothetical protein